MQTLGCGIGVVRIWIGDQQGPVAVTLRCLARNRIQLAIETNQRRFARLRGLDHIAIVDRTEGIGVQLVAYGQWHARHKVGAAKQMLKDAIVIRQQPQIMLARSLHIGLLHLVQIDEHCGMGQSLS